MNDMKKRVGDAFVSAHQQGEDDFVKYLSTAPTYYKDHYLDILARYYYNNVKRKKV